MNAPKYLIDTNVFIGLEDEKEVSPQFAALLKLAAKHHVDIFVHDAARDDIARDRNEARRQISLSKFRKFQSIDRVRGLTDEDLARRFGPLNKPNDVVDATLLHALTLGAADFLVTEDGGLHERARRYAPEVVRRVLYVGDATLLLRSTYEPIDVPLRFVEDVAAHSIPLDDPIFDSLREGYPEFDEWWRDKCIAKHRRCWVVTDEGKLAGIVVRKDETRDDTDAQSPGTKILKICTFKVTPEKRGVKLGELLLKQIIWFAQFNGYDVVYLTAYPEQQALIDFIQYYGFTKTLTNESGEMTYERTLSKASLQIAQNESAFHAARLAYPRFYTGPEVPAYLVPIQEEFHEALFPELRDDSQPQLFEHGGIGGGARKPGNTIRKVYLSRTPTWIDREGALLFFYKGVSQKPPSQAVTTVCVFEDMTLARSTEELRQLAGGRSVYSERQIAHWEASHERPVKVINFLLAGHFAPVMSLAELRQTGVIDGHPPQSICSLDRAKLDALLGRLDLGFALQ